MAVSSARGAGALRLCAVGATDIRPHHLRSIIRRRESRLRHFPTSLFADLGWDIVLDFALARLSDAPLVLRAARTTHQTTIDRWIGLLAEEGLVTGLGADARLSDRGLRAIDAWLSEGTCERP